MTVPKRVWSRPDLPKDVLVVFGQECVDCEVSEATRELFLHKVTFTATERLTYNMLVLIGLLSDHIWISNILDEGIDIEEKTALLELEDRGMSDAGLEVAHGLLNIHERWLAMKTLRSLFMRAREREEKDE